ncbi:MAG: hypothetical protein HC846_08165 [Blastocatellia bacterium]|nr:hypothetical protein [Blastocatellia bacterium]
MAQAQKKSPMAKDDENLWDGGLFGVYAGTSEGDVSELQQDGALTDRDAHGDGAAILDDLYGSAQGAEAALGGLAGLGLRQIWRKTV